MFLTVTHKYKPHPTFISFTHNNNRFVSTHVQHKYRVDIHVTVQLQVKHAAAAHRDMRCSACQSDYIVVISVSGGLCVSAGG